MMFRFFVFISFLGFCPPSFSNKDFAGSFVGGGVEYLYNRADLNGLVYRGMSCAPKIIGGHGWTSSSLYYGIEGEVGHNTFSKNKKGERLTKKNFFGASLRLGQVLRSHFLPFMRLGVKYHQYKFQFQNKQSVSFTAPMMAVAVGVDAFFEENFSLKSELGWAWSLGTPTKKVSVSKRPFELGITMGIAYHF